jgi:alpha-galactosidase
MKIRMFVLLSLLSLLATALFAQAAPATQAVQYDEARKIWLLTTSQCSYAMGLDRSGYLQNLYWGAPLWRIQDIPAVATRRELSSFDPPTMLSTDEYPGWGGARYFEAALKITRDNGDRDLVLAYKSHANLANGVDIELQDIKDAIAVTLRYRVYPAYGLISRSAVIHNRSTAPFVTESAQSAVWNLPAGEGYRLSYITGRWAAESQLVREPIHTGMKILESRRGHTSHGLNPWFAIDPSDASEETGRVWFGALAWSGNWRITVEQTPYSQVRVTGGFNTFDFAYPLKPGESLETPEFYAGFSENGFGGASRILHRFQREQILPGGAQSRLRPVLYNSWEATSFRVTEEGQKALADKAAKAGVELFVVDDGWFGRRDNDRAGLGDWFVNPLKFPQGMNGLIQHVNNLGMDFGLWVEPEMINANSDLYRAHPDWVMNWPNRPRTELRTQMVLNFARDDVKEHIFGVLDKLATEHNIRYFKWDMNRPFSEPGWPEAASGDQRKLWVKYVLNVYEVMDRLRAKHPKLEIESCSGGGGRIDMGILRRVDEVWPSDNTEAFDRLRIQEGFTQAYTPKIMSAWVTDVPNQNGRSTSLQYRFLVAMQGALGIGANITRWSDQEAAQAADLIAIYKRIRATVQTGNLYRLLSPSAGDVTANQYVSIDGKQSALFVFRHSQQYNTAPPTILLRGLDDWAIYQVRSFDNRPVDGLNEVSGAYLMKRGINFNMRGDYGSALVILERVN